jgi:hypothetical protein
MVYFIVGVAADMKIARNLFNFELTSNVTAVAFLEGIFSVEVLFFFIWFLKKLIRFIVIHIMLAAIQSVLSNRINVRIVSEHVVLHVQRENLAWKVGKYYIEANSN